MTIIDGIITIALGLVTSFLYTLLSLIYRKHRGGSHNPIQHSKPVKAEKITVEIVEVIIWLAILIYFAIQVGAEPYTQTFPTPVVGIFFSLTLILICFFSVVRKYCNLAKSITHNSSEDS